MAGGDPLLPLPFFFFLLVYHAAGKKELGHFFLPPPPLRAIVIEEVAAPGYQPSLFSFPVTARGMRAFPSLSLFFLLNE